MTTARAVMSRPPTKAGAVMHRSPNANTMAKAKTTTALVREPAAFGIDQA